MKDKTKSAKSRLRLEIKEITAEGSFEGLLSPYGNVDGGGDVVEPGAYTKTLKDHGNKVPLLWQHKSDVPIGELTLEDRKDGLWCKGQLLMELTAAQQAYLVIKARIVTGLSIGFETVKDAIEKGVRRLKEIRLYEGSVVTFPMNEMALITSVKSEGGTKGDFNEEFEEIQTLNSFYDMQSALSAALRSVIWSDLTRDEKVTAAETILQQFTDAFAAFFPDYIDMLGEVYGESWYETYSASRELERKAGAAISSSNADKIRSACEAIKGGHDNLIALLEAKAGSTTLASKAADPQPEPDTEDHSAVAASIDEMRSLIPA